MREEVESRNLENDKEQIRKPSGDLANEMY